MTKQEFDAWKKETEKSVSNWQFDEVQYHNNNVLLFYKGGENGSFINIDPTGLTLFGEYNGAIPHIMEACFTVTHRSKWETQKVAFTRLCKAGGLSFLKKFVLNYKRS